jgi:hypothetical protein
MWTSILAMLGGVIPKLFNWWIGYKTRKAELEQVNRSAEIAAGLELGTAQLASTGRRFKQLIVFIFLGPLIISMVYGVINTFLLLLGFNRLGVSMVHEIFLEMRQIDEWNLSFAVVLASAVLGIQAGTSALAKVFTGVSEAWRIRRDTASIVKDMDVDRKVIFDGIRNMNNGKGLSQDVVDYMNKVIDEATKAKEEKK